MGFQAVRSEGQVQRKGYQGGKVCLAVPTDFPGIHGPFISQYVEALEKEMKARANKEMIEQMVAEGKEVVRYSIHSRCLGRCQLTIAARRSN